MSYVCAQIQNDKLQWAREKNAQIQELEALRAKIDKDRLVRLLTYIRIYMIDYMCTALMRAYLDSYIFISLIIMTLYDFIAGA